MKRIILPLLLILLTFSIFKLVNTINDPLNAPRLTPHYKGIDPRAIGLVNEYVKLAKDNNINFTRQISIGFEDVNSGDTIGVCFYRPNFREIQIDLKNWNLKSPMSRKELLFHELTHCLCSRGHDYGYHEEYPSVGIGEILDSIIRKIPFYEKRPGFYADECPKSIMYPRILSDQCNAAHSTEYFKEMFDRCWPY